MYQIRTSRNNDTNNENGFDPSKTMEFMRETPLSLELPRDRTEVKRPRPACKWQEVPGDVIKINLDGAIQISS
jgi:hypothetical protein